MEQKGSPEPAAVRVGIRDGAALVKVWEEAMAALWSPTLFGPSISAYLKGLEPRAFAQGGEAAGP